MKPLTRALIMLIAAGATALAWTTVAGATVKTDPIPVKSTCLQGWYVNPDEGDLLPEQLENGLLFDGPSLVHHLTNFTLATTPTDGVFDATVEVGMAPLFKMETTNPYSTLNKTPAGKWWTTKIASGDGSAASPVDSPAGFVGKWNFTAETKVFSFGVGYANDAGNKALVRSVTYDDETYDLTCCPPKSSASPSLSPTANPTASPTPTTTPTETIAPPTTSPTPELTAIPAMTPATTLSVTAVPVFETSLPVTSGSSVSLVLMLIGSALMVVGGVVLVATRRRRTHI